MTEFRIGRLLRSRMRMQHLYMLLLIDKHKNIHRVAEVMGVTQPAITKSLKELESMIGRRLFDRSARTVEATAACAPLLVAAKSAITALDDALMAATELSDSSIAHVRIGALRGAPLHMLTVATISLNKSHPNLHIHLQSGRTDRLLAELAEGSLDLVLGNVPTDESDRDRFGIHPISLRESELCVVVGVRHALAKSGALTRDQVLDYSWVLPPEQDLARQAVDREFSRVSDHRLPKVVEATQLEVLLEFLATGQWAAVMDMPTATRLVREGALCIVRHPFEFSAPGSLALLSRRGSALRPAMRVVLDHLPVAQIAPPRRVLATRSPH